MKPPASRPRVLSMTGQASGEGGTRREGEAPDDVDRAFARLVPLPPPRTFAADVLRSVRGQVPESVARLGWGEAVWAAGGVFALVAVLVLAFLAAQAFVWGGASDLLAISLAGEALGGGRGDAFLALADAFPWIEVLALGASLALLATCTRRLSRALADPPAAEGT
jgi:hypothetical protein